LADSRIGFGLVQFFNGVGSVEFSYPETVLLSR